MYRIDILNFGWASFEAPKGPGSATIKIRPSSFASVKDSRKVSTWRKAEMLLCTEALRLAADSKRVESVRLQTEDQDMRDSPSCTESCAAFSA